MLTTVAATAEVRYGLFIAENVDAIDLSSLRHAFQMRAFSGTAINGSLPDCEPTSVPSGLGRHGRVHREPGCG